jgi:microcin C transport system ATP-binding protein
VTGWFQRPAEVGLSPEHRTRFPNEFSGGQRQRIALARALVLRPEILVLDEPTSSLDRTIQFQVIELLRRLQESHGLTYLFISHDLKIVKTSPRPPDHEGGEGGGGRTRPGNLRLSEGSYTRELLATAFETGGFSKG